MIRRLQGPKAVAFREDGAETFVRGLGGDDASIRELRGEEEEDELTAAMGSLEIDDRRTALMERRFRLFENARRSVATWDDSQVQETIRNLIDRHVVTLFEESITSSVGHPNVVTLPSITVTPPPPAPATADA